MSKLDSTGESRNVFPSRLYLLDALRGTSALVVVFWHWQHFFYGSSYRPEGFVRVEQFGYDYLSLFYNKGFYAVELFFALSGFVFFWLYSEKIFNGNQSAKRFFLNRFSRLYPLHILTFLGVLVLQYLFFYLNEYYFVYAENDLYHALLNVLLIPSWGLEEGWSFNAPVWSVSVEVLLYLVFFITCLKRRLILPASIILVCVGFSINEVNHKIAAGLVAFFSSGICYYFSVWLINRIGAKWASLVLISVALVVWVIAAYSIVESKLFLFVAVFPLSVSSLATLNIIFLNLLKRVRLLGDISYSVYLIHFPLQLIFVLVIERLGYGREVFYSGGMMVVYMLSLLLASYLSYRHFERPIQKRLR